MPLKDAFRVETTGFGFMAQYVNQLKSSQFMTAVAGSMRKGAKPVKTAVKSAAQRINKDSSGATVAAIDYRVRRYPKHSTVVGMVGAKTKFSRVHKGKVRKPFKYAHLLEYGHRINRVKGSHFERTIWKRLKSGELKSYHYAAKPNDRGQMPSSSGDVQPYPYIGPGMQTSRSQYVNIMAAELPKRVEEAAKKAAAKTNGKSP